ncbi:hypothetical protein [Chryseobacterium contaminans]|uniref:hypothetical protein n=1 Tax=Chryseobacterium contaminans TaxID=1423959 RepID=UPI0030177014
MKNFIKYDYYIQVFFLVLGPLALIMGDVTGLLLCYFTVGIPQLISFLIRLFLTIKKTPFYIVYGILIIPVWISVLLIAIFKISNDITEIPSIIVMMAFFYSPLLAIFYVYEYHDLYKSLK